MSIVARRKFTVKDLLAMVESGFLAPDERLELIEGAIYTVTPASSDHAGTVKHLNREFQRLYASQSVVSVQDPLQLSEKTLVEPDVALLKYRDDLYRSSYPTGDDVFLIVEVSKTTLAYDQEIKLPLYAEEKIPEVWIVNLVFERVEVYREPGEDFYHQLSYVAKGEALAPLAFPESGTVVLRADL
jgi:Uma2 family endonuclease